MSITGERDLLLEAARWIPASLMFSGIAIYVTLSARLPALSVAVVGILWFAFKFLGGALLPGLPSMWPLNLVQPFAWGIHPYLQPGDLPLADWWLNRVLVTAIGIILIMLAVRLLRDEERVLLSGAKTKRQTKGDQ
jgi:hypothetical protein